MYPPKGVGRRIKLITLASPPCIEGWSETIFNNTTTHSVIEVYSTSPYGNPYLLL
jgi:hypothetical protein